MYIIYHFNFGSSTVVCVSIILKNSITLKCREIKLMLWPNVIAIIINVIVSPNFQHVGVESPCCFSLNPTSICQEKEGGSSH